MTQPARPLLDRAAKESAEDRSLAPFAQKSARSRGRRYPESPDPLRSAFERDRDRIVHCTAFRRLMYKTQVFLNREGDHNRTRLSHSLEVCQVARSVGSALGLNEPLCEALALAHDIGHPPFGHRGEQALDALLRDHGGFRHNAQVLRVVDLLERRSPDYPGLNLTSEVRESLLKHERAEDWPADLEPRPTRPCLEAQVVDLSDSTAYNVHDVEDGLRAGMFAEQELRAESALWRRAEEAVERRWPGFLETSSDTNLRVKCTANTAIGICINDAIAASHAHLCAAGLASSQAAQAHPAALIVHGPELASEVGELKAFLYRRFYRHPHLQELTRYAAEVLGGLYPVLLARPYEMAPWYRAWAGEVGAQRAVCDYLAGMTDRFAEREHERLCAPGARPPVARG